MERVAAKGQEGLGGLSISQAAENELPELEVGGRVTSPDGVPPACQAHSHPCPRSRFVFPVASGTYSDEPQRRKRRFWETHETHPKSRS